MPRTALIATLLILLPAGSGRAGHAPGTAAAPAVATSRAEVSAPGAAARPAPRPPERSAEGTEDDEEEIARARVLALRAEILRSITGDGSDRWGVLVVSLDHGDTLFAYRPDEPLTPASNLKLFTTAAALFYLGPAYRYGTYVASAGKLEGGVLEGDLLLYGTGDPSITTHFHDDDLSPWRALADTLAALGVREVRGDVVGDASYFPSPSVPEGWQDSYRSADYAAQASALSFHDNTVSLRVLPAAREGWRPRVLPIPGGRGIAITNVATTTDGGPSRITVERLAYDGPVVVAGRIPRGHRAVWREVPVADPARYAAAIFREALEARGILLHGDIRSVNDPARSPIGRRRVFAPAFREEPAPRVLAVHTSPPLQDVLTIINHRSNNMFAEQVLRTLGREAAGDGSAEGGARAVQAFLEEEVGIQPGEVQIYDGSGLSVLNRVTPTAIIALLDYMARSPRWEHFHASLPLAGTREGLRRMQRTAAENNLRAKTGTIRRVSALSGYVRASNGELLGFAIISNDVASTWRSKGIENQIGAELARFSRPVAALAAARGAPAASGETGSGDARAAADSGRSGAVAARPSAPPPDTQAAAAPEPPTRAAPEPAAAPDAPRTHTIRPGDTLEGIGKRYGVSVSALREANPGLDPRRLIPGREVRLPGG